MADKCQFVEDFVALIDHRILERAHQGFFQCDWGCRPYLSPALIECLRAHYISRGFYVGNSGDMYVAWTRPTSLTHKWKCGAEYIRDLTLQADISPQLKCREFCFVARATDERETFQHEFKATSSFHAVETPTHCDLKLQPDEIGIFTEAVVKEVNDEFKKAWAGYMTVTLLEPTMLRIEYTHRQSC